MEKDKNQYKILVIEDNIGDFVLIEDFLNDKISDVEIIQARSFKEGEIILADTSIGFDIILLDLSLPDKSGEYLIKDIVKNSNGVPIIVLTGYVDLSFGVTSLSLGAADYLLKDELSPSNLYKSIIYSIERKKHSIELEQSEKRYSDLFHLNPQSMWVYDTETGKFLDVNNAALAHYGYSKAEFLSLNIENIFFEDDLSRLNEGFKKSLQRSDLVNHGVFKHQKKNGEIISVDVQSNFINFRRKSVNIVILNDITERLNYIAAIERQNEKLREIAWIQSHVVRAPLTRLMGLIDLFKNHDFVKMELLEDILNSAYELDHIIRNIAEKTDNIN